MEVDVAIVGGGIAGLACAVALRESGLRIAVFESSSSLGGRACSWTDQHTGDDVDLGPHIVLTEYRNMLAFLEQLGTRDRIVWETDRLLRLGEGRQVTDMRLHALPPPFHLLPSFARVRSVSWSDVATTLDEIQQAIPAAGGARLRHAVVNRIPMAIPCPLPGIEQNRPATRTPIEGLLLAGDWTDTGLPASMESAVHSGWAAAESILRWRGQPRSLVLPKRAPEGIAGWVHRHAAR